MKSVEIVGGLRIVNQNGNATVTLCDKSLTEKSHTKSLGKLMGCGPVPWSKNFEVTEDMRQAALNFRDEFATPDAYKYLDADSKKAISKAKEQMAIAIDCAIITFNAERDLETKRLIAELKAA